MSYVISGLLLTAIGFWTWKSPRVTGVMIWSLIATTICLAALMIILPFDLKQFALWLTIIVPVVWVGLQFWCYWDNHAWRPTIFMIFLSLISLIIIFSSDPII